MIYSDDVYMAKIRSPIFNYGITSWVDHHGLAGKMLEMDLEKMWYRAEASRRGLDWRSDVFDASRLLQGFNYVASGTETIAENDVVCVLSGHTAGGVAGEYYQAQSDLGSINLSTTDYTTASWELVTPDRIFFQDASTYLTLFIAYRYLAAREADDEYQKQREYWGVQYNAKLEYLIAYGIGYDFDGDGLIDYTENNAYPNRYRLTRV